jgi:peptidyl-tRNA hydrolase
VEIYMKHSRAKIALGVRHDQELLACIAECEEAGLIAVAIKDAGRTVFERPTFTVGAVGPSYRKDLPKRVRRLRLFDNWQAQAD